MAGPDTIFGRSASIEQDLQQKAATGLQKSECRSCGLSSRPRICSIGTIGKTAEDENDDEDDWEKAFRPRNS